MILYNSKLQCYYSDKINRQGIISGFGTKYLPDGRNNEKFLEWLDANNIECCRLFAPNQIHSDTICIDNHDERIIVLDGDGVISNNPKTVLRSITGDCVPVIFVDHKKSIIGISHQGWKGTSLRMVEKMVKKMTEHGADLHNIIAVIGPCIGACCYEIDDERKKILQDECKEESKLVLLYRNNKIYLNLLHLNYLQLLNAGLTKDQIDYKLFCTYCDSDTFSSYRREGKAYKTMINWIVKVE